MESGTVWGGVEREASDPDKKDDKKEEVPSPETQRKMMYEFIKLEGITRALKYNNNPDKKPKAYEDPIIRDIP